MCIKGSHSSANHPANSHIPEDAINHPFCNSRVALINTCSNNTFDFTRHCFLLHTVLFLISIVHHCL